MKKSWVVGNIKEHNDFIILWREETKRNMSKQLSWEVFFLSCVSLFLIYFDRSKNNNNYFLRKYLVQFYKSMSTGWGLDHLTRSGYDRGQWWPLSHSLHDNFYFGIYFIKYDEYSLSICKSYFILYARFLWLF